MPKNITITPAANGFTVSVPGTPPTPPAPMVPTPPTIYVFATWTLLTQWITAQGWTIS